MDYGTRAKKNFLNGYNCCQAVFLACTDELGLDTETRAKIASSFGGGMGGMRQVCGAVSGMLMALGLHQGYTDPKDKAGKAAQYEVIRENGSIFGGVFVGWDENFKPKPPEERTEAYYKKRPCGELCQQAAEILEAYLKAHPETEA